MSYVYFILNAADGMVKVGFSENPKKRFMSLKTSSGRPLELLGQIAGDRTDERRLHKELGGGRITGEWFTWSPDVEQRVKSLLAERGVDVDETVEVMADPYTVQAAEWVEKMMDALMKRGASFRGALAEVATRVGFDEGTVSVLRNSRRKAISVPEYVAIKDAYMALLEEEVQSLYEQLHAHQSEGMDDRYDAVAMHLAAARKALGGGQ